MQNPTRLYIYIYILDIALWCKNQIEHSIWDESLLFSNCARSLEYSSSSTLAGLSYHICGKLEVAFKASPSSQHQHCTDEAQKAETVLSAVIYIYIYICNVNIDRWMLLTSMVLLDLWHAAVHNSLLINFCCIISEVSGSLLIILKKVIPCLFLQCFLQ